MDPLSVIASVAGLLTAAHEVVKLLGRTRTLLLGLQTLVRELSGRFSLGGALVGVDQVVTILTSGVLLFAELEGAAQGLVAASPSLLFEGRLTQKISGARGLFSTQYRLPLRARMQWARREDRLAPLLTRLQGFKVSVTVVLTLLQCDSDRRAHQLQMELAANVSALLQNSHELSQRMMHLEDTFDVRTIKSRWSVASSVIKARSEAQRGFATTVSPTETEGGSISAVTEQTAPAGSVHTSSAPPPGDNTLMSPGYSFRSVYEFESDLETSRVYRRAQRDTMDFSFRSSLPHTRAWSVLSSYSLADVSVLSVIALPLGLEDIANRHHYMNTDDQQLAPVAEEEPSTSKSKPSLTEEGSIFHDCLRMHTQLLQIPGFQELFNTQWRSQWGEKGVDISLIVQWEDDKKRVWQELDVFRALKSIFQEDVGYRLLTDELARAPTEEARQRSWCKPPQQVTYLLQLLCIELGFDPDKIPWVNSILPEDNVYSLKMLACVSKDLECLASAGTIKLTEIDDLDDLVSGVGELSLLPKSAYKRALERFVDFQRSFVRDLLCLINTSEKDWPLQPVPSQPDITALLSSSYVHSEIELLLMLERMLLSPFHLHLWASTVRQWSNAAVPHYASMIIQGTMPKQALQKPLTTRWYDIRTVDEYLTLVTRLKPSTIIAPAAQFFQEIFGILLGDSAGIETISPTQKDDLAKCQRLVIRMLTNVEQKVKRSEVDRQTEFARQKVGQTELDKQGLRQVELYKEVKQIELDKEEVKQKKLSQKMQSLLVGLEDRIDYMVKHAAIPIQADKLKVTTATGVTGDTAITMAQDVVAGEYHVYLFEGILLYLEEYQPATEIGLESLKLPQAEEVVDVLDERLRFLPRDQIFLRDVRGVRLHSRPGYPGFQLGSYEIHIRSQSDSGVKSSFISFTSEEQLMEWYESLVQLIETDHVLVHAL